MTLKLCRCSSMVQQMVPKLTLLGLCCLGLFAARPALAAMTVTDDDILNFAMNLEW